MLPAWFHSQERDTRHWQFPRPTDRHGQGSCKRHRQAVDQDTRGLPLDDTITGRRAADKFDGGLSAKQCRGMRRQRRSSQGPPTKAYPQRYVEETERSEGRRWQAGHAKLFCRQTTTACYASSQAVSQRCCCSGNIGKPLTLLDMATAYGAATMAMKVAPSLRYLFQAIE